MDSPTDTAQEIVAGLGEIAGAARAEGLREILEISEGGGGQKKGQILYDFMAQGTYLRDPDRCFRMVFRITRQVLNHLRERQVLQLNDYLRLEKLTMLR